MAIYNEILAGRFARGIQKIFSMKGAVPVKQAAGEVMSVVELENFMSLEHRLIFSVRSFTFSSGVGAGGAGTFAAFRMRNPVGSNVVVTLEKFLFVAQTAVPDQPFITRGPTGTGDLGTIVSGQVSIRDLRMGPVNSTMVLSTGTPVATVGVQQMQLSCVANTQVDGILIPNHEIVIAPGDLVTLWSHVANQGIAFTFMWRERALEESETFG